MSRRESRGLEFLDQLNKEMKANGGGREAFALTCKNMKKAFLGTLTQTQREKQIYYDFLTSEHFEIPNVNKTNNNDVYFGLH